MPRRGRDTVEGGVRGAGRGFGGLSLPFRAPARTSPACRDPFRAPVRVRAACRDHSGCREGRWSACPDPFGAQAQGRAACPDPFGAAARIGGTVAAAILGRRRGRARRLGGGRRGERGEATCATGSGAPGGRRARCAQGGGRRLRGRYANPAGSRGRRTAGQVDRGRSRHREWGMAACRRSFGGFWGSAGRLPEVIQGIWGSDGRLPEVIRGILRAPSI